MTLTELKSFHPKFGISFINDDDDGGAGLSMSKLGARCQSRMWDRLRALDRHSIFRAFLSTWMHTFHKVGASDKSGT